jgi:hypothetical protein
MVKLRVELQSPTRTESKARAVVLSSHLGVVDGEEPPSFWQPLRRYSSARLVPTMIALAGTGENLGEIHRISTPLGLLSWTLLRQPDELDPGFVPLPRSLGRKGPEAKEINSRGQQSPVLEPAIPVNDVDAPGLALGEQAPDPGSGRVKCDQFYLGCPRQAVAEHGWSGAGIGLGG